MSDDPEHTAAISDAYHEGFGAGIGHVEDAMAERVAAAEARGYDRAIANQRDESRYRAWASTRTGPLGRLSAMAYLEAVKDTAP
jgi:hypothetical protein